MMRHSMLLSPKVMSIARLDSTIARPMATLNSSVRVPTTPGARSSTSLWCHVLASAKKVDLASLKHRARATRESVQYFAVSKGVCSLMYLCSAWHNVVTFTSTWFREFSTAYSTRILQTWPNNVDCLSSGPQTSMSLGISGMMCAHASFIRLIEASFSDGRALCMSSSARRTAASMMYKSAKRCTGLMGSIEAPRWLSPTRHKLTMVLQCVSAGAFPQNALTVRSVMRRRWPT
mmetsp:Transcript_8081/g.20107  ORF Transcript_8081/g.20107 Transcript_8081/m.20107 type:complete len:233 (+) Transcript_8081:501-1199(+)